MNTEYEIRILEINQNQIIKRLEELGANFAGKYNFKRYVYDLRPREENKWIRLRTDGKETTLTLKNVEEDTIDGTKELEFKVESFEKANEFMERMGFKSKGYQENTRIKYILNGAEIDIDTWPMIPTYMEIEGKSIAEVNKAKKLLEVDEEKVTALNCEDIYKKVYGIDIDKIKNLKF